MNRSITVMFTMGLLAMVMLTVFGSFFMGKVGGAENLGAVRRDIVSVFGSQMASPESLTVRVLREEQAYGVAVRYAPDPALARREGALAYHIRRLSDFVLSRDHFRKHASFLVLELTLPDGKVRQERFVRKTAPVVPAPADGPR